MGFHQGSLAGGHGRTVRVRVRGGQHRHSALLRAITPPDTASPSHRAIHARAGAGSRRISADIHAFPRPADAFRHRGAGLRPDTWTLFVAGCVIALAVAAALTAFVPRLYPWGDDRGNGLSSGSSSPAR